MKVTLIVIFVPLLLGIILLGGGVIIAKLIVDIMWNNSHKKD